MEILQQQRNQLLAFIPLQHWLSQLGAAKEQGESHLLVFCLFVWQGRTECTMLCCHQVAGRERKTMLDEKEWNVNTFFLSPLSFFLHYVDIQW